ncbi:FeoA family protein [Thermovibrio sp.]
MVSLPFCGEGKEVRVREIKGGKRALERLSSLGIYPGAKLEVLNTKGGPVLVKVGESRIGLGFGIASKVFVEEER